MKNLEDINSTISCLLQDIETKPAEDALSDELVQSLLDKVSERQIFVKQLIADDSVTGETLQSQIDLTQEFLAKATLALQHRQDLLSVRKSNKQKINVYKNIESNR